MHAVNAFFGRRKLKPQGWAHLGGQFDAEYGVKGSAKWTYFPEREDGSLDCLIAWVIRRDARYDARLIPHWSDEELHVQSQCVAVFQMSTAHCSLYKKVERRWYHIDSRGAMQCR